MWLVTQVERTNKGLVTIGVSAPKWAVQDGSSGSLEQRQTTTPAEFHFRSSKEQQYIIK